MSGAPDWRGSRRQPPLSDRRLLAVVGDLLAILLAVLLSLVIWLVVDGRGLGISFVIARLYWFPLLAALWMLLAHANDFYSSRVAARLDTTLLHLVAVTLQLVVVYLVIFFFSPRDTLPRLFILYYGILSVPLIAAWRALSPYVYAWTGEPRRAIVVGGGRMASAMIDVLLREAPGDYEIVGLVTDLDGAAADGLPVRVIERETNLPDLVRRERVSEIILAQGRELSGQMFQAITDCYEQGVAIVPMPLLYEQITGRVPVEYVEQQYWIAMLPDEGGSFLNPYPPVKRVADVVLSLAGLAVFAVLLPVIALAIRLDSPGPVLFRQQRVGKNGRVFTLIKLRTMIRDAERDTGPLWATSHDPRVTRVGRALRRARLDEVPQLINVLRGEMSLIGPRPERPAFVDALNESIPFYRTRHAVKPGITGWAQVRYPYGNTPQDALVKLQYDLYYIRHRSLALDVVILLRTAGRMLTLRGM